MDVFMYKEGVVDVISKLSRDDIYGNIPELVRQLQLTRKEEYGSWLNWWENYLLDAGLTDKRVIEYSHEIAVYAAEQCGITLYHIDSETQKEVKDVYTWQAELFRSHEFEQAARALTHLYKYCEARGFIDNEATDENGRAYRSISLELRRTQFNGGSQRISVETILSDEANGTRVESITI